MKKLLIMSLGILFLLATTDAQEKEFPFGEIKPIAEKALAAFGELVTEQNYKRMGFETLSEVKEATLGDPLRIFTVGLDELKAYVPGEDPTKLLNEGQWVIYPVLYEDQVRSSIEVEKLVDRWEATKFGGPNLIKMLMGIRASSVESTDMPLSAYFAVRVPALNLYFIAYRAEEKMMLIPILDNRGFKFKAGAALPAEEVFEILLPAAKTHKGLPG